MSPGGLLVGLIWSVVVFWLLVLTEINLEFHLRNSASCLLFLDCLIVESAAVLLLHPLPSKKGFY